MALSWISNKINQSINDDNLAYERLLCNCLTFTPEWRDDSYIKKNSGQCGIMQHQLYIYITPQYDSTSYRA